MRSRVRRLLHPEKQETASKQLEDFLSKRGTVQKWLSIPEEELDTLCQEAERLLSEKHYSEARRTFALLTLLAPNYPKFWRLLSCAQIKERNRQGALRSLKIYLTLLPDDSRTKQLKEKVANLERRL